MPPISAVLLRTAAITAGVLATLVFHIMMGKVNEKLAQRGLSMSQFRALEALLFLGPLPLATLGRKISSGASNMTMVNINLEKRGLAVRRTDDEDTRKMRLHLTRRAALVTKTFPNFAKIVRAQMDALDGASRTR